MLLAKGNVVTVQDEHWGLGRYAQVKSDSNRRESGGRNLYCKTISIKEQNRLHNTLFPANLIRTKGLAIPAFQNKTSPTTLY